MSFISPEQQADWAIELLAAVGDNTSSSSFATNWLRTNLGFLNSNLSSNFQVSGSGFIVPELNSIQSGIYNEMFICAWLKRKARLTLGAMDFDWTEMEGDDQGKIKRVSNTQKSSVYQSMSKDCDANFKELIKTYRGGDFARPRQITFNDRLSTPKDISCICFKWSDSNPILN